MFAILKTCTAEINSDHGILDDANIAHLFVALIAMMNLYIIMYLFNTSKGQISKKRRVIR